MSPHPQQQQEEEYEYYEANDGYPETQIEDAGSAKPISPKRKKPAPPPKRPNHAVLPSTDDTAQPAMIGTNSPPIAKDGQAPTHLMAPSNTSISISAFDGVYETQKGDTKKEMCSEKTISII